MDELLSDVVVVDLSRALAGPHAAMMLGDMGARAIKVESPHGDDTRGWGPPFVGEGADRESVTLPGPPFVSTTTGTPVRGAPTSRHRSSASTTTRCGAGWTRWSDDE